MTFLPINLIISLLFMVSVIAVGIFIQVKLSRSENKYLGLILPILSFLSAVLMVLGMYSFSAITTESLMIIDEAGEVIEESEEMIIDSGQADLTIENVLSMGYLFLVSNIPTAILGGIYVSERNKITMRKSIEKMKIEDL